MSLTSLGYVGVPANGLDEWIDFAANFLGMQLSERVTGLAKFRTDERAQRLIVEAGSSATEQFFGWEVATAADLDVIASRLELAKISVTRPQDLASKRGVADVIAFRDPDGNRLEVFHGAESAASVFIPGRSISGFRTGSLGLGHIVLTTKDIARSSRFYRETLGFRLSDFITKPFTAEFFHLNERHHSLALVQGNVSCLHHLMLEVLSLDDVGQAYDLALLAPERVGVTLGRHTNDHMTSFYAKTPTGFLVEYGWGGRAINPSTWTPEELQHGPSLWGHERLWLSEADRELARTMRLSAASDGLRAPVHVVRGFYEST